MLLLLSSLPVLLSSTHTRRVYTKTFFFLLFFLLVTILFTFTSRVQELSYRHRSPNAVAAEQSTVLVFKVLLLLLLARFYFQVNIYCMHLFPLFLLAQLCRCRIAFVVFVPFSPNVEFFSSYNLALNLL